MQWGMLIWLTSENLAATFFSKSISLHLVAATFFKNSNAAMPHYIYCVWSHFPAKMVTWCVPERMLSTLIHSESQYLQATRAQDHSWMDKWSSSNLYSTFPLRCSAMAFMHSLISLISCFSQSTSLLVNTTAPRFSEGLEVFWQKFNHYSCILVSVWHLALATSLLVSATRWQWWSSDVRAQLGLKAQGSAWLLRARAWEYTSPSP